MCIRDSLRILLDGEEDLHENRTCVLVPNKRWALMAQQVLSLIHICAVKPPMNTVFAK